MIMNGKSCLIPILMRYVVLRNKIMPFVCVGEIITIVLTHFFSAALGWWTPGVDAIHRVLELVQMHINACITKISYLLAK